MWQDAMPPRVSAAHNGRSQAFTFKTIMDTTLHALGSTFSGPEVVIQHAMETKTGS